MAHTSDRTLLASLGFSDPDKKDRRHTLACQYLCQPDVAQRLWCRVFPELASEHPTLPDIVSESPSTLVCPDPVMAEVRHVSAAMEVAIMTDRKFLVGFWDVVLSATVMHGAWKALPPEYGPTPVGLRWGSPPMVRQVLTLEWFRGRCADLHIEVKARPVDVADIARQVETYRRGAGDWGPVVVATCYPMPAADRSTLNAKKIHHVYLGDGLVKYIRGRETEPAEDNGEL